MHKEVEKDGEREVLPPKYRREIRKVLDSSAYILFCVAEDNGITMEYEDAL